jgi:hypothetical protein
MIGTMADAVITGGMTHHTDYTIIEHFGEVAARRDSRRSSPKKRRSNLSGFPSGERPFVRESRKRDPPRRSLQSAYDLPLQQHVFGGPTQPGLSVATRLPSERLPRLLPHREWQRWDPPASYPD